jgi:pyrroline-5-carboxylate reductase
MPQKAKKIAIIGFGNMGQAIYKALTATDLFELFVCNRTLSKLESVDSDHASIDPNHIISQADTIIFATKPQQFESLASQITVDLSNKLVISIMAGVCLSNIQQSLGSNKLVRSMPNLGTLFNTGVCGWYANEKCTEEDKDLVRGVFELVGYQKQLSSEQKVDKATIISGAGIGYFFYLAELLEKKAIVMGFDDVTAKMLAKHTLIGAGEVFANSHDTPTALRQKVSSKGGVTEAVITKWMEIGFDKLFDDGLEAGIERVEELK